MSVLKSISPKLPTKPKRSDARSAAGRPRRLAAGPVGIANIRNIFTVAAAPSGIRSTPEAYAQLAHINGPGRLAFPAGDGPNTSIGMWTTTTIAETKPTSCHFLPRKYTLG